MDFTQFDLVANTSPEEGLHLNAALHNLSRDTLRIDTIRVSLNQDSSRLIYQADVVKNKYMRGLLHCFWPPTRPLNILRGWVECGARAQSFAEQFFPEAKVLITGHFHRSGVWKYPQRPIGNTGAWVTHATPYVLDMRDGQILSYLRYNSHIGLTY